MIALDGREAAAAQESHSWCKCVRPVLGELLQEVAPAQESHSWGQYVSPFLGEPFQKVALALESHLWSKYVRLFWGERFHKSWTLRCWGDGKDWVCSMLPFDLELEQCRMAHVI